MSGLLLLVVGDSAVLITVLVLVHLHVIRLYPDAVLVSVALLVMNGVFSARTFLKVAEGKKRNAADAIARRRTTRLIWAFSIGTVIVIAVALATRDSRYVVQAIIGTILVGYMYFILQRLGRKQQGSK